MALQGEYAPSAADYARDQVALYEETNGQQGADMRGRPVVILTMLGAKSGKIRKTPLMRVEHDGKYAVVASLGGAPQNPAWYANLKTHPRVELQDGADRQEYEAREIDGEEREVWWDRAVQTWPDYAEYQTKTTRRIPVFVLDPVS